MTTTEPGPDIADAGSTTAPLWADVGRLASELIRIDTSNPGRTERPAAELVADALSDLGATVHWFEPSPRRASVVARIPGTDRSSAPLLVHGHLDVVPANDKEWSRDPFGGDLVDGYVWGRGAVDMKGSVASVLSALWTMHRSGIVPRRDLVLAFFADEEAGGEIGAGHVTAERPELFAGCAAAIGEVGGFSYRLTPDRRAYFVATGEKGVWWTRLTTRGRPGHGSMINPHNPISALADYLMKIVASFGADGESLTPTTTATFEALRGFLDRPDATVEELLDAVGPMRRMLRAGLCNTVNPTQLEAGFKTNVVPGTATATIDGRFLPGTAQEFQDRLHSLLGADATVESVYFGDAVEADPGDSLLQVIGSALTAEDEAAVVVPYLSTAFTDAKWISKLGVPCYGFAPLLLPDDLDFTALFHGVDERVPVDALEFGARVLARLFTRY